VTACDDQADNRILECALEAQAQVIITGDDDLLRLKRFESIRILTPRAFLDSEMRT
jgi:predicted nucleic acid-binding protein